jgi:hypothetical protein
MAKTLQRADKVSWRSHGVTVVGSVLRKLTRRQQAAGRQVAASEQRPQFLVRSRKTGRTAVHKPEALHKR